MDQGHHDKWVDAIGSTSYRLTYMPTISYRQLITSPVIPFHEFDFVNLDIEGSNWGVFMEIMSLHETVKRAICVEFDDKKDEMMRLAMSEGFTLTHITAENMIFTRK